MNPLKMLGYRLRLVRLQVANEMPDNVITVDCGDLFQPLLDEILAEIALADGLGLQNGFGRLFLADGEQPDLVR